MVRELASAELESSRQKGVDDARKIVAQFTEDMSTDDRLEKLSQAFDLCSERCLNPVLDNFDPAKFYDRDNYKKGSDLKIMLLGAFKAASKMDEIVHLMDDLGRNKMNGHTEIFLKQREECDSAHYRLFVAKQMYLTDNFAVRARGSLSSRLRFMAHSVRTSVRHFLGSDGMNHTHG